MRRDCSPSPHSPQQTPRNDPPDKASYEANAEVQRWLREQTPSAPTQAALQPNLSRPPTRPPLGPLLARQLLRGRPDRRRAEHGQERQRGDGLLLRGGSGDRRWSTWRPRSTGRACSAACRTTRSIARAARSATRRARACAGDRRWRATAIERGHAGARRHRGSRYEFETQRLLYEAGADVPRPFAQIGNALLMEYIGDGDGRPRRCCARSTLAREEARTLFEQILRNIELFLACDRIHGDLSAYNILYWQGAGHASSTSPRRWTRATTCEVSDLLRARCRARLPLLRALRRRGRRGRAGERYVGPLPAR